MLSSLYLAKKGTYTFDADIHNSYTLAQVESRRQLHERLLASKRPSKFPAGTRYDDDFLHKPRPQLARREGKRSTERMSSDQESDVTDERARTESVKKDKRVRVSSKGRVGGSLQPAEGADPSTRASDQQEASESDPDPSFTILEDQPHALDVQAAVSTEVASGAPERGQVEFSEELRRKLVVIDTQLSRLREARRQIDNAISTLERMRERCTASGS